MLHPLEKDLQLFSFDDLYNHAMHLEAQGFEYGVTAPVSETTGALIQSGASSDQIEKNIITVAIGSTLYGSNGVTPRPALAITHRDSEALQVKFGAEPLFQPPLQVGALVLAKSAVLFNRDLWDVIAVDPRPEEEARQATGASVDTQKLVQFLLRVRDFSYSIEPEKKRLRHDRGEPPFPLFRRELLLTNPSA